MRPRGALNNCKTHHTPSIDALAANPPESFHSCVSRLFPGFEGQSNDHMKLALEARDVRFLSFARLANRLSKSHKDRVNLDRFVLIIAEVHNLFRPLAHQKAQHNLFEKELVDVLKHPSLKMVIMANSPSWQPRNFSHFNMVQLSNE